MNASEIEEPKRSPSHEKQQMAKIPVQIGDRTPDLRRGDAVTLAGPLQARERNCVLL
jgi:hypothetical protein